MSLNFEKNKALLKESRLLEFLLVAVLITIPALHALVLRVNISAKDSNRVAQIDRSLIVGRMKYLRVHSTSSSYKGACTEKFIEEYLRDISFRVQDNVFCRVSENGDTVTVMAPLRSVEGTRVSLFDVYHYSAPMEVAPAATGGDAYCYTPDGNKIYKKVEINERTEELVPRWCVGVN